MHATLEIPANMKYRKWTGEKNAQDHKPVSREIQADAAPSTPQLVDGKPPEPTARATRGGPYAVFPKGRRLPPRLRSLVRGEEQLLRCGEAKENEHPGTMMEGH